MSKKIIPSNRLGWLLDEMESAGRENFDVDHVKSYDKKENAEANNELNILKDYGLNQESVIVDIGAGTGQFTLAAASFCKRVVAVDVSSIMLDVLQDKIDRSEFSNVEVVRSGFLTYNHQGQNADFVYSRFALHHLPDFWKALAIRRIRNLLQPSGLFRLWDVVYNFKLNEADDHLEKWCSSIENESDTEWNRSDVEEHIRDEHSTFTWLLEPIIERNNFTIEDVEYSADGLFAKYVARAI